MIADSIYFNVHLAGTTLWLGCAGRRLRRHTQWVTTRPRLGQDSTTSIPSSTSAASRTISQASAEDGGLRRKGMHCKGSCYFGEICTETPFHIYTTPCVYLQRLCIASYRADWYCTSTVHIVLYAIEQKLWGCIPIKHSSLFTCKLLGNMWADKLLAWKICSLEWHKLVFVHSSPIHLKRRHICFHTHDCGWNFLYSSAKVSIWKSYSTTQFANAN